MYGCISAVEVSMQVAVKGSPERLRAKRKEKKWTQARLGKESGLTSQSVSNHERGETMTLESLVAYARALGCRPEELAEPESAELVPPSAPARPMYPAAVVQLLRARKHLDPADDELAELARYVADGNPDDVDSLEIHLLIRRAERHRTAEAVNAFLSALRRAGGPADGVVPWKAADQSSRQPQQEKQAPSRSKKTPA